MDANEFFNRIVRPNYDAVDRNRDEFRSVWNAAVSLNTIAEYLALHRSRYVAMTEVELNKAANTIRNDIPQLGKLNNEVIALKHVRSLRGVKKQDLSISSILSSTAYLPDEPVTWEKLKQTTEDAFAIVSQLDEFK
jgi:hypothetical protein